MGTSKKRRHPPRGVWELKPSDSRRLAYEQQTTDWHRTHPGATTTESQAAWDRIAKRLRLRAPRFQGGPTDERIAMPVSMSIPPEHLREWARQEFSRVKQRLRSEAPVTWQVTDAAGHLEYEQRPLPPPPPPYRSGRPRRPTLTDEILRRELAQGRTPREIAQQLGFHRRTIEKRITSLPQ